jgi:hypothetical protein
MTPVYHVGDAALWIGGQDAASDIGNLVVSRIQTPFSVRGFWGCHPSSALVDQSPFSVDEILGWDGPGQHTAKSGTHNWALIQKPIQSIEATLMTGHSLFVFCKQGCRRARLS